MNTRRALLLSSTMLGSAGGGLERTLHARQRAQTVREPWNVPWVIDLPETSNDVKLTIEPGQIYALKPTTYYPVKDSL